MRALLSIGSFALIVGLCLSTLESQEPKAQDTDPVLRAMQDELKRSSALHIVNLDPPYFFEYRVEDTQSFEAAATLGGVISTGEARTRIPMVQVRVGDYNFDNTNHIYSEAYSGARYDPGAIASRR